MTRPSHTTEHDQWGGPLMTESVENVQTIECRNKRVTIIAEKRRATHRCWPHLPPTITC